MDASAIKSLPLFAGLTETQLDAVARVLNRRQVGPGVVIFSEGERSRSMFILISGSVGTWKRLGLAARGPVDPTREKVLVHLQAPQFFGEMALLSDMERSATIRSDTACEIFELTRTDFEQLAASDRSLGYCLVRNIAEVLAERIRRADLDILKLTTALSLALGNR